MLWNVICSLVMFAAAGVPVFAGERYFATPLSALEFVDPMPPSADERWRAPWRLSRPHVVLDQPAEVWVASTNGGGSGLFDGFSLLVRTSTEGDLTGRVFLEARGEHPPSQYRFRLAQAHSSVDDATYLRTLAQHFGALVSSDIPGAAWFRHRERSARVLAGPPVEADNPNTLPGVQTRRRSEETLDVFLGARALAENLQLDRDLIIPTPGEATVELASIAGIETRAIDWKSRMPKELGEPDPLAALVPFDQHAVFFPSFEMLSRVSDELDRLAGPLCGLALDRGSDERVLERYQAQLCLPLSSLARAFGPALVSSVAVTGGDTFLPSGSDVAVLFQCKQPAMLATWIAARQGEAVKRGAKFSEGRLGAWGWRGAVDADRSVSSFLMAKDDVLVVANSRLQLERIAAVSSGDVQALAALDEYKFFRTRYRRGAEGESAFLILSDAAIRRWCSPRWRIADSRRTRTLALLAEVQAANLERVAQGDAQVGASAADPDLSGSDGFMWTRGGPASPVFGSLAFATPIGELPLARVSPAEQQAYARFRDNYQRGWRAFFDPIAARLAFDGARLRVDLSVLPLIDGTDYDDMIELTRGAKLAPDAGDPHPTTLGELAFAFGRDSELARGMSSFGNELGGRFGTDPLAWMGEWITLYAEQDPFWGALLDEAKRDSMLSEEFYRLPVVIQVSVKDPLRLAAFLTAARTFVDGAASNLLRWENAEHDGQTFVRVRLNDNADLGEWMVEAALCYVATNDVLIITLREDLLKQALDRRKARKSGAVPAGEPWLGESYALRLRGEALELGDLVNSWPMTNRGQQVSWRALPILNEWKRLFPERDPVELHQSLWQVKLVGPDGSGYVWNAELGTMESTSYGSPWNPKRGPNLPAVFGAIESAAFGLTFEDGGLRAKAELVQTKR